MNTFTETIPVCHDCGAKPGEEHRCGCDVEHCPYCGGQRITCDCGKQSDDVSGIWTGNWDEYPSWKKIPLIKSYTLNDPSSIPNMVRFRVKKQKGVNTTKGYLRYVDT